jgi:phage gp37-like protein
MLVNESKSSIDIIDGAYEIEDVPLFPFPAIWITFAGIRDPPNISKYS